MEDGVRPPRYWYAVAGAIVALGLVAAGAGAVLAGVSAQRLSSGVAEFDLGLRSVPDDPAATTEFEMSGGTAAVYAVVTRTGTGPDAVYGPAPAVSCSGDGLRTGPARADVTTVQDGVAYRPVATVRADSPGTYLIGCATVGGTAELAVGRELHLAALGRVSGGILGTVAGVLFAVVSAVLGLVLGGAVALVTAVRRSAHRAALAAGPHPAP